LLTDGLELPEGAFETVDALVTKSDGPRFLLSTLQSVLGAEPVQFTPGGSNTAPGVEIGHDRRRFLDDLKSLIDSFAPRLRERVIAEVRSVFAALAPQCCAPALISRSPGAIRPSHDFRSSRSRGETGESIA
jgi:hypothetical protein